MIKENILKQLDKKTFQEGLKILGLKANQFVLVNDDCYDLNLEINGINDFDETTQFLITFTLNDEELFAEEKANKTDENLIESRFLVSPEIFDYKGYWHYFEIK